MNGGALVEPQAGPCRVRSVTIRSAPGDRFWAKVDTSGDCWLWMGNLTKPNGYGRLSVAGVAVLAHRYSYELVNGTIPVEIQVDHLCMNKRCVRPSHLDAVTPGENTRRWWESRAITSCKKGHARSEHGYQDRGGRWRCRVCMSAWTGRG